MSACQRLRPALLRVADGEADPAEALRVARHVASCTSCRIVAHRERRLRAAFEGLEDGPTDSAFLDRVMEALPSTPPPPPIGVEARRLAWLRRRRNRVLGFGLLAVTGAAAAAQAAGAWWFGTGTGLPHLTQVSESGSALGALVTALLMTAGSFSPGTVEAPHVGLPAVVAGAASLGAAGLLALGAAAALGLRRALSEARSR
ncbi:MAG TPA: zf-HC2 domain-containing protein [Candidatus Polarisedimenticolaceae bacterium]